MMGSGELTASMVEVHKELLGRLGSSPRAVFLDTPAGFQLNVDQISERAVEFFRQRVRHPLTVVSLRSAGVLATYEGAQALGYLRRADYVLVGPGSPTYAVRQWRDSPVPDVLAGRVGEGRCVTAASAAALTLGRFTLPVYEIYKVGADPHWVEGINLLGRFGLDLAVVPHWNNAEGGTHDTRFCYTGEPRFRALEALLPDEVAVLGIDEHTACVLDLGQGVGEVRGIGGVTVRRGGAERIFNKGERFDLSVFGEGPSEGEGWAETGLLRGGRAEGEDVPPNSFWEEAHRIEEAFHGGTEHRDFRASVQALLDFDRLVWMAHRELSEEGTISQVREALREMLVLLGEAAATRSAEGRREILSPLVQGLLNLRERWRGEGKWVEADALREQLLEAGIHVEDTREGTRWHSLP